MTATVVVTPDQLAGDEVVLTGDAYHHWFRAARLAAGVGVRLVDGAGRARHGTVGRVERRRATVRLGAEAPSLEPGLRVELLVATPRPSRASWLVEKGTELGVAAFRFLDCDRGERPLAGGDLERLRRVARAAVEQCGRSWLPAVTGPHRLEESLRTGVAVATLRLDPAAPVALGATPPPHRCALRLLVGPEGGLTQPEIEVAAALGATAVRLVPAILRVETAALAAAAWALVEAAAL